MEEHGHAALDHGAAGIASFGNGRLIKAISSSRNKKRERKKRKKGRGFTPVTKRACLSGLFFFLLLILNKRGDDAAALNVLEASGPLAFLLVILEANTGHKASIEETLQHFRGKKIKKEEEMMKQEKMMWGSGGGGEREEKEDHKDHEDHEEDEEKLKHINLLAL